MYYESYRRQPKKRKRRARRQSFGEWLVQGLLKLVALAVAAVVLCAALLYALPPSTFMVEPEHNTLGLTDGLPADCINVLLLGTDLTRNNAQRSDAIMIASIGYGKVRLSSFLRDTVVDIPGHGSAKLNAAFAYGGAELTMRTLNRNFGLNIMHYAQVDFLTLVRLVDAIGGVDVSVTEKEREYLNKTLRKSYSLFAPLGYTAHELTEYGDSVHLDGLQALSYARIRKLDSDFMRTSRQRRLLSAMLTRVRSRLWDPLMWTRLVRAVLASVETNMPLPQIISLAEKALLTGSAQQLRLPVDGSFTDDGSKLTVNNRNANRDAFYMFVYEN